MSARQLRRRRQQMIERQQRRPGRPSRVAAGTGAALGAAMLLAPVAQADTFEVTKTDDTQDGTCAADDCSLREAVDDANALAGLDQVTFDSSVSGQIELNSGFGPIYVSDEAQIQGPGADVLDVSGVDATGVFKLFGFDTPNEEVSISGLTLTRGAFMLGGAISSGGDYSGPTYYAADLTVAESAITDSYALAGGGIATGNISGGPPGPGFGGEVTIRDTTISDNYAQIGGGLITISGEPVTVERSTIAGNRATDAAGGLGVLVGDATIDESTISGNVADQGPSDPSEYGGGVIIDLSGGDSQIEIADSTISGNRATGDGGGLGIAAAGTIRNSTVSGNSADSDGDATEPYYGAGGGLNLAYGYGSSSAPLSIENTTIAANSAFVGGGINVYGEDAAELSSSLVGDNTAVEGGNDIATAADSSVVLGFSLVEDLGSSSFSEAPAGSNRLNLDPMLGPLTDNGGPTETQLPALLSPAVDNGVANGLTADQRGLARTSDLASVPNQAGADGTDMGSTELQASDLEAECRGAVARKVDGTPQADTLSGSEGADRISGGDGDDSLSGLGGDDCVAGDGGDDTGSGGTGADLVTGAAGADRLKGNGGRDKLKGAGGKDRLKGGGGKDKLSGGAGKDKLKGSGGKDKLKGNGGKDRLRAAGGGKDKVNCGGGKDRATVDAKDKVSPNCETVTERT